MKAIIDGWLKAKRPDRRSTEGGSRIGASFEVKEVSDEKLGFAWPLKAIYND
jgi:hypothetical protein